MNYQNYLCTMTKSGPDLLHDWRWAIVSTHGLWQVTKAGNVLLQDSKDGSIHLLDVTRGDTEKIADGVADFEEKLEDAENQEKWLNCGIVDGQGLLGMRPAANQCLSFIQPPILGGQIDPDNFEICDIAVHLSISGQVLRQVKNLPPGSVITDINIQMAQPETKRAWWKFW